MPSSPNPHPTTIPTHPPRQRVLVVDEDTSQRATLSEWLHAANFTTTTVGTGQEGVGLCRRQRFDLILADIANPGSDGLQMLLAVTVETPDLPLLVIAGDADAHAINIALRAGAWDYLAKPFQQAELVDRVNAALARAERLRGRTHTLQQLQDELRGKNEELAETKRLLKKEVGARQQIESQLQQTVNEWQATFDSISDFITIHDQDYTIVKANKALIDFLGKRPEEVIGQKCCDIMHGSNTPWPTCPHRLMLSTGKASTTEVIDPHVGIPLLVTASPIHRDGQPAGFVHIAKDISRVKMLEEERRKNLNLESLSTLCGGLAHDFNNLLTALSGYIELALLGGHPDSQRQWLNQAKMVTNLSVELTKQLSAFSKGGEPILSSLPVSMLIQQGMEHLRKAMPQLTIDEHLDEDVWNVLGDNGQLRTVIRNICYNAAEAMEEGGTLRIEARNMPRGSSQECALSQDAVLLRFIDQGVGIPAHILDKVFDPYFTTSPKGAAKGKGLGLSLCHTIVSRHHGRITIASQPDRGTTVSVFLPAAH